MNISKTSISNYKSISDKVEINFSQNKTVFVGKNNSGKSNILSVLNIFFGDKYPAYYKFDEEDFFDIEKPIEFEIEISDITQEEKDSFVYQERFQRTDKGRITSNGNKLDVKLVGSLGEKNKFEVSGGTNKSASDPVLKGVNSDFWNSLCSYVYIPSDRNINNELRGNKYSWYGKLLNLILENKKETEDYKKLVENLNTISDNFKNLIQLEKVKEISNILTYIEDIKISLSESSKPEDLLKKIEILAKSEGLDFQHISRFGTGTQSSIILGLLEIYLETLSQNNSSVSKVFVVDEPENFLHPQAKRLINQILEDLSKNHNTQVIYSTHSSELVSCFEENGFRLSDIKLVKKNKTQTQIDQFTNEDNEKFSKVIATLNADNAEIFFASKILLVEGETDKHSIPNIFKYNKWTENDLSEEKKKEYGQKSDTEKERYLKQEFNLNYKNISIINVGGKSELPKWFEFCSRIIEKENVYCLIDKDPDFETKDKKTIIKTINSVFNENLGDNNEIDFEKYNWLILEKGEFENYYVLSTLAKLLSKTEDNLKSEIENKKQYITDEDRKDLIQNFGKFIIKNKDKYNENDSFINIYQGDDFKKEIEPSKKIKQRKYSEIIEQIISNSDNFKDFTKPTIAYKLSKNLIENDGYDTELIKILKNIL